MAKQSSLRLALMTLACIAGLSGPLVAEGTGAYWGAKAASLDQDRSVEEMMRYAIEDEYLARAEYLAITRKHGSITPFSNIIRAEESHISWLKDAYKASGLTVPADDAASHVTVPGTLKEAFQAGVAAEIDNIAMYDSFLASPIIAKAENASLKALFIRLRDASKNHLAAFRNGLSRY